MKYHSGEEVNEGDIVTVRRGGMAVEATVLKIILPNTEDARNWSAPDGGVLIEGGSLGRSVTKSLEDDEDPTATPDPPSCQFELISPIDGEYVVQPQVLLDEHPPHRVGADAVHPLGQGGLSADEVEAGGDEVEVAPDGRDGAGFRVHVADPDQAVALDAIPEIVLHVEVDGVGADLPDVVEPLIIAFE